MGQAYSLWQKFRRSPTLVVSIVFVTLMVDLLLMTTLEPILPSILYAMELDERRSLMASNLSAGINVTKAVLWSEELDINSSSSPKMVPGIQIEDTTWGVGIILSIKPGVEIVANVFVGFVVDRFGHKVPMIIGCFCNVIVTFGLAYVNRFWMLLVARIIQAIGSSLSVVSGLALLASFFQDEEERSRANGVAFGGLSLGIILGYPLGTTFYEFFGRPAPFLVLAALMFGDAVLRLIIVTPNGQSTSTRNESTINFTSYITLLLDPYITLALGCSVIVHTGLGMILATEPAWIIGQLDGQPWQTGVVILIGAILQFTVQFISGIYSLKLGRWLLCWIGLLLSATGYILYPFCVTVWHVIGPECLYRAGLGAVLTILSPLLAFIGDSRHDSTYGAIYGMYAASYNLGFIIGPVTGGTLMHIIGFDWMCRGMGIFIAVFSCTCLCFRRIEGQNFEKSSQEEQQPVLQNVDVLQK